MHVAGRRALILAGWTLAGASIEPPLATAQPPVEPAARAGAPQRTIEAAVVRAAEIDFTSLHELTRKVMRHELTALLRPADLAVSWRRTPPHGETDANEIRVVLMRSAGAGTDRGALGSALPRGRPVAATIWLYVPTVAAALELDPERVATSPDEQRLMGTALGRVLAHEVVHVLAPEREHARAGLMRASLHPHHLTSGSAAVEADCRTALLAGARAWLAQPNR